MGEYSKNMWKNEKVQGNKRGERSKVVTYTLCGGDVHIAADKGQAVVHADLEINHPGIKQDGFTKKS